MPSEIPQTMHFPSLPPLKHRRRSTASTVEVNENKQQQQQQRRVTARLSSRRSVSFSNQPAQIHTYDGVSPQEYRRVWFTPRELEDMQKDALIIAARLMAQPQDSSSSSSSSSLTSSTSSSCASRRESVLRVYRACRGGCSRQEFMMILASATGRLQQREQDSDNDNDHDDEESNMLGLHDMAIPAINRDYLLRRRHLQAQIRRIQSIEDVPEEKRTKLLQEASCSASNVARSFAVYLAFVNAEDVQLDQDEK